MLIIIAWNSQTQRHLKHINHETQADWPQHDKSTHYTWSKFICDFGLISSAVQERLTKQIAMALVEAVNPAGVGVVIEAT